MQTHVVLQGVAVVCCCISVRCATTRRHAHMEAHLAVVRTAAHTQWHPQLLARTECDTHEDASGRSARMSCARTEEWSCVKTKEWPCARTRNGLQRQPPTEKRPFDIITSPVLSLPVAGTRSDNNLSRVSSLVIVLFTLFCLHCRLPTRIVVS